MVFGSVPGWSRWTSSRFRIVFYNVTRKAQGGADYTDFAMVLLINCKSR